MRRRHQTKLYVNRIESVLQSLRALARPDELDGMARFGISTRRRLGVRVPDLRALAKRLERDHELALGLWDSGIADARILASMVADPARVTSELMDRWVAEFDSWDVCDQVCMNLFDKTDHAWEKVRAWAEREEEYVRRAAFALLACIAWHDKRLPDDPFVASFPLIERAASDPRNYVKKAVSWALRHIGKRNASLHPLALAVASALKESPDRTRRWIGSDAVRDLTGPAALRRLERAAGSR